MVTSTSTTSRGFTRISSSLPNTMSPTSPKLRGGLMSEKPPKLGPTSPVACTSMVVPTRLSRWGPSTTRVLTEESPSMRTLRPTDFTETRASAPLLAPSGWGSSGPLISSSAALASAATRFSSSIRRLASSAVILPAASSSRMGPKFSFAIQIV